MMPTEHSIIRKYPLEDEAPHKSNGDRQWQESIAFTWWDDAAGIGGFHRLAHELGAVPATLVNWNGVMTRDGVRFRRHVARHLRADDQRPLGFACAPLAEFEAKERPVYRLNDPDCELNLECGDYFQRTDLFPANPGALADDFASCHFEVGCKVTGTARVGGRRYEIDGLGYRDHSWGKRDWSILLSHRWVAGTFGPDLSFCALTWHGTDQKIKKFGILVRNGEVIGAKTVDIVTYMEADATTCRGGEVTFTMPDGESLFLIAKPIDGLMSYNDSIALVDTLCTVEYNGRKGFCDFETSSNPRQGKARISPLERANDVDGLSRRSW